MVNENRTDDPAKYFTVQYSRRAVAIERILGGITTDEIEKATSYEQLLATVVAERDELLNLTLACMNDISIWDKVAIHIESRLSQGLKRKVLQHTNS